jgi:hypothetical protein
VYIPAVAHSILLYKHLAVDAVRVSVQELVSIMAASKGCVLMAPPAGNAEAQKTMAGMLSAIKPKTKV